MSEYKENANPNCTLTPQQVETLARGIVMIADRILDYYKDPAREEEYQRWYEERYGHPAPEWDRIGGAIMTHGGKSI